MTHWALVQHMYGLLNTVYTYVGLQVALGGEGSATDLTFEWPLPSMDSVVHL